MYRRIGTYSRTKSHDILVSNWWMWSRRCFRFDDPSNIQKRWRISFQSVSQIILLGLAFANEINGILDTE